MTGEAPAPAPTPSPQPGPWLDPLTGVVVLGLDWLLFGSNLLSGLALTPVVVAVGAVTGFGAVYWIERRRAGRGALRSLLAGALAGIVVGAPLPLGGTIVGGAVIAMAGLPRLGR